MSLWSRLANVFRSGRVQRELDEELQFHLDERIRELLAAGMTREAAAAQVARRFGSPLRWREQSLDVKLLPVARFAGLRDVRLGLRMLRKNATVTGRRGGVAVARAWRMCRGVLAGRRADSEAAARAQAGTADLS